MTSMMSIIKYFIIFFITNTGQKPESPFCVYSDDLLHNM